MAAELMKIYFVDTQPSEREYFREKFSGQDLEFVSELAEVGDDAVVVSIYIRSRIDRRVF